jgi:hypothetical protein
MEGRHEDSMDRSMLTNWERLKILGSPIIGKGTTVVLLLLWRDHVEEIVVHIVSGANILILSTCLGNLWSHGTTVKIWCNDICE